MLIRSLTFLTLLLLYNGIKCETYEDTTAVDDVDEKEDALLYIDNRIDEIPTYVPPAEKLIKSLVTGLGFLTGRNSDRRSAMDRVFRGITKPISSIFHHDKDAEERSMKSTGFGEILNSITDHFRAIYPGKMK